MKYTDDALINNPALFIELLNTSDTEEVIEHLGMPQVQRLFDNAYRMNQPIISHLIHYYIKMKRTNNPQFIGLADQIFKKFSQINLSLDRQFPIPRMTLFASPDKLLNSLSGGWSTWVAGSDQYGYSWLGAIAQKLSIPHLEFQLRANRFWILEQLIKALPRSHDVLEKIFQQFKSEPAEFRRFVDSIYNLDRVLKKQSPSLRQLCFSTIMTPEITACEIEQGAIHEEIFARVKQDLCENPQKYINWINANQLSWFSLTTYMGALSDEECRHIFPKINASQFLIGMLSHVLYDLDDDRGYVKAQISLRNITGDTRSEITRHYIKYFSNYIKYTKSYDQKYLLLNNNSLRSDLCREKGTAFYPYDTYKLLFLTNSDSSDLEEALSQVVFQDPVWIKKWITTQPCISNDLIAEKKSYHKKMKKIILDNVSALPSQDRLNALLALPTDLWRLLLSFCDRELVNLLTTDEKATLMQLNNPVDRDNSFVTVYFEWIAKQYYQSYFNHDFIADVIKDWITFPLDALALLQKGSGHHYVASLLSLFQEDELKTFLNNGRALDHAFLEKLLFGMKGRTPLSVLQHSAQFNIDFHPIQKGSESYEKIFVIDALVPMNNRFDLLLEIVPRMTKETVKYIFQGVHLESITKPLVQALPKSELFLNHLIDHLWSLGARPLYDFMLTALPLLIQSKPFPESIIENMMDKMDKIKGSEVFVSWMKQSDVMGLLLDSVDPQKSPDNEPGIKFAKQLYWMAPLYFNDTPSCKRLEALGPLSQKSLLTRQAPVMQSAQLPVQTQSGENVLQKPKHLFT